MFSMLRLFPLIAGGTLLVLGGTVHGLWTDRWGASAAMRAAADRLQTVPLQVADWDGQDVEMNARHLAVADVAGHLSRRYVQRSTGSEVSVILLCGRPGPLAVHCPEVCFAGAGYGMDGAREKWTTPAGGEFWVATFRKPGPDPQALRIFWAWGTVGDWVASEHPRWQFSPAMPLYKLYVARPLVQPNEPFDAEPARRFLQAFVPELRKHLALEQSLSEPLTAARK